MENLNKSIDAQIKANKAGLGWGKAFLKGTDLRETRRKLISNRIELKRIKYASGMNPAAAVFGESQVGKSYLVDNLLTSKKGSLLIYDGYGKGIGFIEKINPIGGGKESTSLVSRFTTKKEWINDDYPIKVMLLSPVDVVLTVCDSFYNDLQKQNFPSAEEICNTLESWKTRFSNQPEVQEHITEDELFEMKEYFFELDVLNKGERFISDLKKLNFFEELALFIKSVNVDSWKEIFGYLWNNNTVLNNVFSKLIDAYKSLNFKNVVYIEMDAILREPGTILDVDRLYELFGITEYSDGDEVVIVKPARVPDMKVWTDDGKCVSVSKSAFCALAAELILKVGDELLKEKPFLEKLDILDFPGARSREMFDEDKIENDMACNLLIRGKVAYLFNKYSQQYLISNLLFCHHDIKSEVKTLSGLLEGWINSMVGETPEARKTFMEKAEIPPLFIVGTKFNKDLEIPPQYWTADPITRQEIIDGKWTTRFTNLSNLIGIQKSWFKEWLPGAPFKNIYLLRAYNYSCAAGIFEGYFKKDENGKFVLDADGNRILNRDENGNLIGEQTISDDYAEFIEKLNTSFLKNDFVSKHFGNPQKSWDEVATPKHDGSNWIIENLTISSKKALESRNTQFRDKVSNLMRNLCETLKSFYHDDNSDEELKRALSNAGDTQIMLDFLFGKDKYFFSDFISSMLVREDRLHDVILDAIHSSMVLDKTDFSVLFAIRDRAQIDPELDEEENYTRMRNTYHKSTNKDVDDYLQSIGFTMHDVINPPMVKNFARIIVDATEEVWMNDYLTLDRFQEFVNRGMPEKTIENLLANMRVLYSEKLHISALIAEHIHPYVSAPGKLDDMAEMLADICAEMINRFVNSVGTAYFYDELWQDVKATVEHNGFSISIEDMDQSSQKFDEEETRKNLNEVFNVFDNVDEILNEVPVNTGKLSYFSNYHAYRHWTELMKIAYLATCGIPKYDVQMNNELRAILLNCIVNVDDLKDVIPSNLGLTEMQSLASGM